jgi:membrane associated rhomboid family serine protease
MTAVTPPRANEPLFNAPWPAMGLVLSIPILYFGQSRFDAGDMLAINYGLVAADVYNGRLVGLFTSLLLHGSWAHALTNAGFALAFAPPVARLFGPGLSRAYAFFGFYVLCGVIAGLGYVLLHPQSPAPLIGASGAVSGLFGVAIRLVGRPAQLGPLFSRRLIPVSLVWIGINAFLGISGLTPGAGGMPVAWEAHIIGYFAGMVLIGPFLHLFARARAYVSDGAN